MRLPLTTLLMVVATAALATPSRLRSQQPSACTSDANLRASLRATLEHLMESDDSSTTSSRRLHRLPLVSPDSIRIITDERLCERAAREYYRDRLGPRPLTGVALAQVGDVYVVYGAERAGEWTVLEVYTRDFELVGRVLG